MKGLMVHLNKDVPELCFATIRGVRTNLIKGIPHISNTDWYHAMNRYDGHPIAYIRGLLFKRMAFARFAKVSSYREDIHYTNVNKVRTGRFTDTKQLVQVMHQLHEDGGELVNGHILEPTKEKVEFVHVSKIGMTNV